MCTTFPLPKTSGFLYERAANVAYPQALNRAEEFCLSVACWWRVPTRLNFVKRARAQIAIAYNFHCMLLVGSLDDGFDAPVRDMYKLHNITEE